MSELLDRARAVARSVDAMDDELGAEYSKWADVVRSNGLERNDRGAYSPYVKTTFRLGGGFLQWVPDEDAADRILFTDGEDRFAMPVAWLEDPQGWLQSALANHGQAVADRAGIVATARADRIAMLQAEIEKLRAEG